MKETDVAEKVVVALKKAGWDVYCEVKTNHLGIADIVAMNGKFSWIIECKTNLSWDLLEQAHKWVSWSYANAVSVAFPQKKRSRNNSSSMKSFLHQMFSHFKIGALETSSCGVTNKLNYRANSEQEIYPEFFIRTEKSSMLYGPISNWLLPGQKKVKPGIKNGYRHTPFQATVEAVKKYLKNNPNSTMKQIMDNVSTHYSSKASAKSSISQYITHGVIKGICRKREGRKVFYNVENND